MPEPVTLLLTQGGLGVFAGILLWLYLAERKRANELASTQQEELKNQREKHFQELDSVRVSQIQREREVAQTLEEYGRSVVTAIDQTTLVAQELRRMNRGKRESE